MTELAADKTTSNSSSAMDSESSAVAKTEHVGSLLAAGAWDYVKEHKSDIALQTAQGAIIGAALSVAPKWLSVGIGVAGAAVLGKHFYEKGAQLFPAIGEVWRGTGSDAQYHQAEQVVRQAGGSLLVDAVATGLAGWGAAKFMPSVTGGRLLAEETSGAANAFAIAPREFNVSAYAGATKSGALLERTSLSSSAGSTAASASESSPLMSKSIANRLAELSQGRLQHAFGTGKVELRTMLDSPGQLVGTYEFDKQAMQSAHDAFSEVLVRMRSLKPEGTAQRAAQIDALGKQVEAQVLPNLQRAGVRVAQYPVSEFGMFGNWFDVPLNKRFATSEGPIDLNTAGGLNKVPDLSLEQIFEPVPISGLPAEAPVPASVKYALLARSANLNELGNDAIFPAKFLSGLARGIDQHTETGLGVILPKQNGFSEKGDRNFFVAVEEITHLFQSLNGNRPFSRFGTQVQQEMTSNFGTLEKLVPSLRRSEIVEYDFPGVLQEFGVTLPKSLLEPYDRGLMMDYIAAHPTKRAELGGLMTALEAPEFSTLSRGDRTRFLGNWLRHQDP